MRPYSKALLQRLAFQIFHDDEGPTFVFIDLINRADVGMIERRGGAGLALEAAQRLAVFSQLFRQKLEGDQPLQLAILGLIDDTHAPATDLLNDAIVADCS